MLYRGGLSDSGARNLFLLPSPMLASDETNKNRKRAALVDKATVHHVPRRFTYRTG